MLQEQRERLWRIEEASGDDWAARVLIDPVNQRVELKSYRFSSRQGLAALGEHLIGLARDSGHGKVLAKIREADWEQFLGRGFVPEGVISGYYRGDVAYCLSYFTDPDRQQSTRLEKENRILEKVLTARPHMMPAINPRFILEAPAPADGEEMAGLFQQVFSTYPTPLHNPDYIRSQMKTEQAVFRVIRDDGRIISAAAAEVDWESGNAEMTDCATLPEYRGEGLMGAILWELELEMRQREVNCLFSLARASSFGMNLVLRRLGYRYRGRMINNCHICGDFEDMNIWVKA